MLLVGDIDRGGVFAALRRHARAARAGGARAGRAPSSSTSSAATAPCSQPGLDFLTARTGVPVLGVVPYLHEPAHRRRGLAVARRTARLRRAAAPRRARHRRGRGCRASPTSTTSTRSSTSPAWSSASCESPDELAGADLVILPGSKSTAADLAWLRALRPRRGDRGARAPEAKPRARHLRRLPDARRRASRTRTASSRRSRACAGLGLLPLRTRFSRDEAHRPGPGAPRRRLFPDRAACRAADVFDGYEIHMGMLEPCADASVRRFCITQRNGEPGTAAMARSMRAARWWAPCCMVCSPTRTRAARCSRALCGEDCGASRRPRRPTRSTTGLAAPSQSISTAGGCGR